MKRVVRRHRCSWSTALPPRRLVLGSYGQPGRSEEAGPQLRVRNETGSGRSYCRDTVQTSGASSEWSGSAERIRTSDLKVRSPVNLANHQNGKKRLLTAFCGDSPGSRSDEPCEPNPTGIVAGRRSAVASSPSQPIFLPRPTGGLEAAQGRGGAAAYGLPRIEEGTGAKHGSGSSSLTLTTDAPPNKTIHRSAGPQACFPVAGPRMKGRPQDSPVGRGTPPV